MSINECIYGVFMFQIFNSYSPISNISYAGIEYRKLASIFIFEPIRYEPKFFPLLWNMYTYPRSYDCYSFVWVQGIFFKNLFKYIFEYEKLLNLILTFMCILNFWIINIFGPWLVPGANKLHKLFPHFCYVMKTLNKK